jgi:hypothetical protein
MVVGRGEAFNIYGCKVSGFVHRPFFKKNPNFRKEDMLYSSAESMGRFLMSSFDKEQLLSVSRQ